MDKVVITSKISTYLVMAIMTVSNSACISYKRLTYLKDSRKQEILNGYPKAIAPYLIKSKDNLFVSLLSTDLEINKLYNSAQAGTGTAATVQYEGLGNQFVYGYEVDESGLINLPLIGKINVAGKSITQAEKTIEDTARFYIKEVTAKVKLLNNRVTVLGEVRNPGVYYKYGYDFTTLEAIGMANGTTNSAQLDSVLVLRPTKDGSRTFVLNLKSKSFLLSDAYYLQPNDVVIVEPGKHKNFELRLPIYNAIISTASLILLILYILKK